jgi:hypothetical protein
MIESKGLRSKGWNGEQFAPPLARKNIRQDKAPSTRFMTREPV